MAVASTVIRYLRQNATPYEVIQRESAATATVAAEAVAHAQLMIDQLGPVLVVVPASCAPDMDAINALLGRRVTPATPLQVNQVFGDCDPRFLPALGDAYGIRGLIDEALVGADHARVYMPGGDERHLLCFTRQVFLQLQARAWFAGGLVRLPAPSAAAASAVDREDDGAAAERIQRRLERLDVLPAMPDMAQQVLRLRADPDAGVGELAALVERDPSLAAQVLRYANAPLFGYRGRVDSIHTAISRVLGYDMVMNLALGVAAARPFRMPAEGALGLRAFWRHAVYSAAMMQALSRELPREVGLRGGTAYLAGLLHNLGLLLLGHLFPKEYRALCRLAAAQPARPLVELERGLLGCDHGWLGARLLETWRLPEEVVTAAREHHRTDYLGPHAEVAALALITDRALKNQGIGDAETGALPPHLLQTLNLDELKILGMMNRILQGCTGLDAMARQLAA